MELNNKGTREIQEGKRDKGEMNTVGVRDEGLSSISRHADEHHRFCLMLFDYLDSIC